jgi:CheY-like chemotaxis protein
MRTILLADDSLAIQRVVGLTFEESEFEVVTVSSGDQALHELERLEPAVVVADVHMPGATGYEVARRVKERRPGTPVLLLVGTFEPFDEEECRASGADAHLLKPFESAELRRRVEAMVGPSVESPVEDPGEEPVDAPAEPAADTPHEPTAESGRDPVGGEPEGGSEEAASAAVDSDDDTRPVRPAGRQPDAAPGAPAGASVAAASLDSETIDRIARRVVEMISAEAVRDIAHEVVPRLAEQAIARRIEELERDVE